MALLAWLASRLVNRALSDLFRWFNMAFTATTTGYVATVGVLLRGSLVVLLIYGGLIYLTYNWFQATPAGFIPSQDKGYLLLNLRLPDSSSLARTQQVMEQMEQLIGETPGVKHTVAIAGQSLLLNANASNFGSMYVMLEDFHHRGGNAALTADGIAQRLKSKLRNQVLDGEINILAPPPLRDWGQPEVSKL